MTYRDPYIEYTALGIYSQPFFGYEVLVVISLAKGYRLVAEINVTDRHHANLYIDLGFFK